MKKRAGRTDPNTSPCLITLLEESGSGRPYFLPSTAYQRGRGQKGKQPHRYFQVPDTLWTGGHIQPMSAPAVAMLLILLSEQQAGQKRIWWSTTAFPSRYHLTSSVRSKGTSELVKRKLLSVNRESVVSSPSAQQRSFARERVRNTYLLRAPAYRYQDEKRPSLRPARNCGAKRREGLNRS